jgi:hypothetical protein
MNKNNIVKVIQFKRKKQVWYATGRTRYDIVIGGWKPTFTKDVYKIPKSGRFYYKIDDVYPEHGLNWIQSQGITLEKFLKYEFSDVDDVSDIKVLTLKERPVKYTLQGN